MGETRTSKVKGRDVVLDKMTKKFGSRAFIAQVGMRPTSPEHPPLHPKAKHPKPRTEAQNIIIFRTNAKRGRNPSFVTEAERSIIQQVWKEGIDSLVAGNDSAVPRAAAAIAQLLINGIKRHVADGISETGSMKPIGERYSKIKKAVWGDVPLLVASGQMLDGLRPGFRILRSIGK